MEKENKFAIHEASRDGKTNVVESLLASNAKLSQRKDDDGRLPIHWAASYNRIDIAKILAQQKDFDPDVQDGSGWTPLMIAVSLKDGEDMVDLLLAKGAEVNEKSELVKDLKRLKTVKYANVAEDFNGQTALHFTASKSHLDIARKLFLQKPPASARVKDKRGQYAIHRAAAVGSVPLVDLLLKNKSPIDATDIAGYTPLHHAMAEGHGDAAVALLKAGAQTDKKDIDGLLAIDLSPDKQVRKYVIQTAEREGIELGLE